MKFCYLRCNCSGQGIVHEDASYVDIDTGQHWYWQWKTKDCGLFRCGDTACSSTLKHVVAYNPATRTARALHSDAAFRLEKGELLGVLDDVAFVESADATHTPLYYPPHAANMTPEADHAVAWGYKANQCYFGIDMEDGRDIRRLLEQLEVVRGRAPSTGDSVNDEGISCDIPQLVLMECFAGTQPLAYACMQAARMGHCKMVGLAAVEANLDTTNRTPHLQLPIATQELVPADRTLQLFDAK